MTEAPQRDSDIDLIKGIACLVMVFGHTGFYLSYPVKHPPDLAPTWIIAECSLALFFMATGMNVIHYVRHNEKKRGWGPTQTYLITNLLLFICGFVYNLNRQSLGLMDLFQGIAVAAFLTYVVFRRNWPSWAIVIIALEMFAISFGYALEEGHWAARGIPLDDGYIAVSIEEFQKSLLPNAAHPGLQAKYLAFLSEMQAFPFVERLLMIHFSVIPWAGCALLGGVIMRHAKTRWEWILWALFLLILVASLIFPFFLARNIVDYFFRGKPDYVLRHAGIAGLLALTARRLYISRGKVGPWVEFIGRESFLVFILQWIFIEFLVTIFPHKAILPVLLALTGAIYALMTLSARYLAKKRDAGMDNPAYAKKWFSIMIISALVTAWLHYGSGSLTGVNLGHLVSFVSCIAFAMAFPSLRSVLRKKPRPARATTGGTGT